MTTLTKYGHACVTVEQDGTVVLLDPGTFTPEREGLLATADAVLVTHDHFDHFDVESIAAALRARPELVLHGPASVVDALTAAGVGADQAVLADDGAVLDLAGIEVRVDGGQHAEIHEGIPVPHNLGYLVAGEVFHPGDSYRVPPFAVSTLLVPISGPWTKTGEAIDFIRAVAPQRSVQVHDAMASAIGVASGDRFLGQGGLTGIPLVTLAAGESLEL